MFSSSTSTCTCSQFQQFLARALNRYFNLQSCFAAFDPIALSLKLTILVFLPKALHIKSWGIAQCLLLSLSDWCALWSLPWRLVTFVSDTFIMAQVLALILAARGVGICNRPLIMYFVTECACTRIDHPTMSGKHDYK